MLLVLIILVGAALGYWIVRKYVISEDGSIDAGIAKFVKWAMRILAVVSVLQVCSTYVASFIYGPLMIILIYCASPPFLNLISHQSDFLIVQHIYRL